MSFHYMFITCSLQWENEAQNLSPFSPLPLFYQANLKMALEPFIPVHPKGHSSQYKHSFKPAYDLRDACSVVVLV